MTWNKIDADLNLFIPTASARHLTLETKMLLVAISSNKFGCAPIFAALSRHIFVYFLINH